MMLATSSDAESMQDETGIDAFVTRSHVRATSQVALAPCQAPISGNRASDRALASLWIQRLKPRDEPEDLNADIFFSNEKKHHATPKEQQSFAVEKRQSTCEWGRGRLISSHTSSSSGCRQDIGGERPTLSVANARYSSEVVQTCGQAVEGRISISNRARAEGTIVAGKPPLPLMHGKCGFPPRHRGDKSQGFPSSSACRTTTTSGMLAMAPRIPSSATKETLLKVSTLKAPLLKEEHYVHSAYDHGIASINEEEVIIDGKMGVTEATHTFVLNPPKQVGSQGSEPVAISTLETRTLENKNGLETGKLVAGKVQSALTGGAHKADKILETASTASPTASFPWEIFAEAGGPSRSARQEFVEVYNRARNELKNQKVSSIVTRVADSETEIRSGLASRGATRAQSTPIVIREGQTSEANSQLKTVAKFEHVIRPEMQKEQLPRGQHCGSSLEGGETEKRCQAYGGACGKGNSSVLHGRPGGAFHRHVETLSVAPKDSSVTVGESSGFRPGFVRSRASEQCDREAFTHNELFRPKLVEPSPVAPKDCSVTLGEGSGFRPGFVGSTASKQCDQAAFTQNKLFRPKLAGEMDVEAMDMETMDVKAPMLLSKRQAGYFDESANKVTGNKDSVIQHENLPNRSAAWLQRWYTSHRPSHEDNLKLDRSQQDLVGGRCDVLSEATERDSHRGHENERDAKKRLIEKGSVLHGLVAGRDRLKPFSEKMLPSAAAMAIVGTAAQQFCMIQPHSKKETSAFWSGYGNPAPQNAKSYTKRGDRRHPFEAEHSSKSEAERGEGRHPLKPTR